jgi:hypothetical protein
LHPYTPATPQLYSTMKLIGILGAGCLLLVQLLAAASNSKVNATTVTSPPPVGIEQDGNSNGNGNGISSSVTKVAVDGAGFDPDFDPDYGLKITVVVRGETLTDARSCQHTFSQVEVANKHATEHISIFSIDTGGEETEELLSDTDIGKRDPRKRSSDLPQQLHVSQLPTSSLTLGPGQIAIVPITFLPRFPVLADDEVSSSPSLATSRFAPFASGATKRKRACSIWQQADLEDWLGSVAINHATKLGNMPHYRSNRPFATFNNNNNDDESQHEQQEQVYKVTTNLRVETNRGGFDSQLLATSIRSNEYGLPDILYFDTSGGTSKSDPDKDTTNADHHTGGGNHDTKNGGSPAGGGSRDVTDPTIWILNSDQADARSGAFAHKETTNSSNADPHQDCYDVYLKHPGKAYIEMVAEKFATGGSVGRNANGNIQKEGSSYKDVDGGLSIAVGEVLLSRTDHLSLQVLPEKATADQVIYASSPSQVIREWTDRGPFVLPADGRQHYIVTVCTAGSSSTSAGGSIEHDDAADKYLGNIGHWIDAGSDAHTLGFLQIRAGSETLFVGLERTGQGATAPTTAQREQVPPVQQPREENDDDNDNEEKSAPVIKVEIEAVPEFVDFHLLSSASPTAKASIGIRNTMSSETVTLMRASVAMHMDDPELAKKMGLKVKVRLASDDKENGLVSIAPAATVDEALILECSVDWDRLSESLPQDSITFSGSLIVRATSAGWTYLEWLEQTKANLSVDSNLILEIPYSISVVNGKIGLLIQEATHPFSLFWMLEDSSDEVESLSSAFFPRTPYDIPAMMDVSNHDFSFQKKGMDHHLRAYTNVETHLKIDSAVIVDSSDMKDDGELSSLCGRFDVSLMQDDGSTLFDLYSHTDLGLIYLRYRFPPASLLGRESEEKTTSEIYPTICYLRLTTEPNTGVHLTPLVIYPGQVDVSAGLIQSDLSAETPSSLKPKDDNAVWHRSIVGFDSLVTWFQETTAGHALRSVLNSSMDKRKSPERDLHLLGRYLYSLARQSMELDNAKLRPVLLKVGAIAQSEMETLPLYLTNHNPIPITIMIDVGEVEGMSISLGRDPSIGRGDGNSLLDYFPRKAGNNSAAEPRIQSGPLSGHPVNGIRQFLLSDGVAESFLTQFPYRDAVSLSEAAVAKQPLLRQLYRKYALGGFHKASHPVRFTPDAWSQCEQSEHPPLYGSFDKKLPAGRMPGPIIVSSDGETVRRLPVCWDRDSEPADRRSDGSSVVLPPGGVARFDINLRAPPSSVLGNDITEFVATGLVLSTDHGEVMPILVAFDALKGKLEVSHIPVPLAEEPVGHQDPPQSKSFPRDGVIRVPVGLFVEPSTTRNAALKIPPRTSQSLANLAHADIVTRNASLAGESSVSLFMKSSFSRDVRLREVSSCNPWFEVVLNDEKSEFEADPYLGVNIGAVSSIVSCRDAYDGLANPSAFPSFFRCALNWLAKRAELQPRGCGLLPAMEKGHVETEGNQVAERGGVERATRAFERALLASEWVYKGLPENTGYSEQESLDHKTFGPGPYKSGRKRSWDGVVAAPIVDIIADAWDSWRVASEFGMRVLSTSLRATIEYNSTRKEKSQAGFSSSDGSNGHLLSVALKNLTIEAVLATPKLLDTERAKSKMIFGTAIDDGSPSVIEFPPTLVAAVSSLMIPLRNPTAVPVRVRLAVAPLKAEKQDEESTKFLDELGVDENIRSHFLGKLGSPYVQNGMRSAETPTESARSLWWDGDGAYFLADYHGDLIRSRYNMTIKAGTGAHVSLVNPSLLSNTAFLTGCGSRCAVRNDAPKKIQDSPLAVDVRMSSPIGASAAGGVTLIGRERSDLPQANEVASDGLYMAAGGSLLSDGEGPAAFAIPFDALDEIIIPPFGEAELGPILFRPPGRSRILGCEAATGIDIPEGCDSKSFESMLFLENSLTGLERVVIRGKTQWESIVFLDPPPKKGLDEFGDIELRNGYYTLVFTGTAEISSSGVHSRVSPQSVVKEVVVHNNGDVPVSFANMFLTDTVRLREKRTRNRRDRLCSLGDFHLLDCSSKGDTTTSFELLPGQNRSLFIEHQPKCSKKKEFVALNLEYGRNVHAAPTHSRGMASAPGAASGAYATPSQSTLRKQAKANEWKKTFRGRKIDLLIGYEMNDVEFASCISASRGTNHEFFEGGSEYEAHSKSFRNHLISSNDPRRNFRASRTSKLANILYSTISIILEILALTAAAAALTRRYFCRQEASHRFQSMLQGPQTGAADSTGGLNPDDSTNWSAAFRCLARGDPASSDLQTLGREQIRQLLLARYRSTGVLPPQCFNSAGIFHRERVGVSNNPGRQIPSKDGNPGNNERIRTLSDAIFRNLSVKEYDTGNLPCELSWRTAVARGIISPSSLEASPVVLKTETLLLRRNKEFQAAEDDEDSDQSVSVEDEGDASSGDYDESDVESSDDKDDDNSDDKDDNKKAGVPMDSVDYESTQNSDDYESTQISEDADLPVEQGPIATVKETKEKIPRIDTKNRNGSQSSRIEETDAGGSTRMRPTEKKVTDKQTNIESKARKSQLSVAIDDRKSQSAETVPARQPNKVPAVNTLLNDTSSSHKKESGRQEKTKVTPPKSNRRKPKIKVEESADEKQKAQDEIKKDRKKTPKTERGRKVKSTESSNTQRVSSRKASTSSPTKAAKESERKTAVVSPTDQPGSPIFRPPPGLAPPPGFEATSTSQPLTTSFSDNTKPILSSVGLGVQQTTSNPPLTGVDYIARPPNVSRSLTGDSYVSVTSSVPEDHLYRSNAASPIVPFRIVEANHSAESIPDLSDEAIGPPQLEQTTSMQGFDVMDFLDGILNDSSTPADDDGVNTEPGSLLVAETQSAGQSSTVLPFSANNPWAPGNEGHQSRAAAYGISFEEEMQRSAYQAAANLNLPLLTPAALLSATSLSRDEDEPDLTSVAILSATSLTRDEGEPDTRRSFYATLLEE